MGCPTDDEAGCVSLKNIEDPVAPLTVCCGVPTSGSLAYSLSTPVPETPIPLLCKPNDNTVPDMWLVFG